MTRRYADCRYRPTTNFLLPILLSLFLSSTAGSAAQAKTLKLGAEQPIVELTVPPEWETASADTGVETTVPGVYLSAELIDADDLNDAMTASAQFLAERKIKLKQDTKTQKLIKVAGLPAAQNDWDGTDPDGPTRVRITLITVAKGKLLVVFYWRSEAAEKLHAPEVEFIMNSVKPLVSGK